jgi:signal transduction histidine kinase
MAMFHEVRNVCSALAINYETLSRSRLLAGNRTFDATGELIATLTQIARAELTRPAVESDATEADLVEVIADVRLVLDPYCEEAGIALQWTLPAGLHRVWVDRRRLLQVLLNLIRNSERALVDRSLKRIDVAVVAADTVVSLRVTDTGPGLSSTEHLFEPFQQGADATGLGLYLSRVLLRSFGGDLRHDPTVPGCSFVIELAVVDPDLKHRGMVGRTNADDANPVVVD